MSATTIFLLLLVAAGALVFAGIVAVAVRRGAGAEPLTAADLDREALRRDRSAATLRGAEGTATAPASTATEAAPGPEAPGEAETTDEPSTAPPPDPALERVTVDEAEYGVTRRQFFNRALLAVWTLFLAQFGLFSLAFMWPKLKGGFGTKVNAGKLDDLKEKLFDGATVIPQHVNAAQAWIVPFPLELLEKVEGNSFAGLPSVVAGGEADGIGVMAMWHRCVHLGCRVPECISSQGFECPCHGSKYNIHGEYEAGPAPRNLDRFAVEVNEAGELIIDTGTIYQTPRARAKTAEYPQGPFCI
ncbi:MAG TPA: hypothetical protein ENK55_05910 [Actinobacteria bacterium]|nr:hypothetical protein [Actinomycetota bacterium]